LVVGGGPIALELMGEFATAYPKGEKKLTLLVRGDRLLHMLKPEAHKLAEEFLKK